MFFYVISDFYALFAVYSLSLTLIQPASKWMHWAILRRHSDLFWAATSTSSRVISILNKSLLTVLFQFVCGRPGPLLNAGTFQCNACQGMRWWSIRITCPSQWSVGDFFHWVCHLYCVDSDVFIYYSVLPGNAQDAPLPSVMSSTVYSVVYKKKPPSFITP